MRATKSGVRGLEDEERDGGPAGTTLADMERQINEPGQPRPGAPHRGR